MGERTKTKKTTMTTMLPEVTKGSTTTPKKNKQKKKKTSKADDGHHRSAAAAATSTGLRKDLMALLTPQQHQNAKKKNKDNKNKTMVKHGGGCHEIKRTRKDRDIPSFIMITSTALSTTNTNTNTKMILKPHLKTSTSSVASIASTNHPVEFETLEKLLVHLRVQCHNELCNTVGFGTPGQDDELQDGFLTSSYHKNNKRKKLKNACWKFVTRVSQPIRRKLQSMLVLFDDMSTLSSTPTLLRLSDGDYNCGTSACSHGGASGKNGTTTHLRYTLSSSSVDGAAAALRGGAGHHGCRRRHSNSVCNHSGHTATAFTDSAAAEDEDYEDLMMMSTSMCAICCEPLDVGETVTWSPNRHCNHLFHHACLHLQWTATEGDNDVDDRQRCPCCLRAYLPGGGTDSINYDKDMYRSPQDAETSFFCCVDHGVVRPWAPLLPDSSKPQEQE